VLAAAVETGVVENLLHSNSLEATAAKIPLGFVLAALILAATGQAGGIVLRKFWRMRRP
jgi:hypothetical protein